MEKEVLINIPLALVNRLQIGTICILDVRTPMEFTHGHIEGALNLPFDQKETWIQQLNTVSEPIIVCSADDQRSALFCQLLRKKGIRAFDGGHWQELEKVVNN